MGEETGVLAVDEVVADGSSAGDDLLASDSCIPSVAGALLYHLDTLRGL